MTNEKAVGNAGYGVWGSGGGGSGGQYVFASLEELDALKTEWTEILEATTSDGQGLLQAQFIIMAPAEDDMSTLQAGAVGKSLGKALEHNQSMVEYARTFIAKLAAAREQYGVEDEAAANNIGHVDES